MVVGFVVVVVATVIVFCYSETWLSSSFMAMYLVF